MQMMTMRRARVGSERAAQSRPWPSLLTAEARELGAEVLRRMHAPELATLFNTVAQPGLAGESTTTRQALHARLQRMQSTITAGALILATHSD
jgi:hypothetical protein